mmetsp:Transcript_15164/g.21166  ORF Transcript_15164/g.21166 Transcript_15164/m.21166 type:complete len:397 (+) Transcript_15164:44-1234(+)
MQSLGLILASVCFPFLIIIRWFFKERFRKIQNQPLLVVLGSGGHTGEMLLLLEAIEHVNFFPRTYVVAASDSGVNSSRQKITQFEKNNNKNNTKWSVETITRAREIGQTSSKFLLTSIIATLEAFIQSLTIVYKCRPKLLLCNGPGTCIPVCFAVLLFNILGLTETKIVYVESFACVSKLSRSGEILYYLRLTHAFCVLWKDLLSKYPRSHLLSTFSNEETTQNPINGKRGGYVLATVGSTSFDELIQKLDDQQVSKVLLQKGYRSMHFQIGQSQIHPRHAEIPGKFSVEEFSFKESMVDEIKGASLVISHGGAATTLEALLNQTPLVLVPNEKLMNNHQLQLVAKVAHLGYAFCLRTSDNFPELLQSFDTSKLRSFTNFVDKGKLSSVLRNTLIS